MRNLTDTLSLGKALVEFIREHLQGRSGFRDEKPYKAMSVSFLPVRPPLCSKGIHTEDRYSSVLKVSGAPGRLYRSLDSRKPTVRRKLGKSETNQQNSDLAISEARLGKVCMFLLNVAKTGAWSTF